MRAFLLTGLMGLLVLGPGCAGPPDADDPISDPTTAENPEGDMAPDVAEVAEVARNFLAALSFADTAALAPLLAPEAMVYSVREGEAGPSMRAVSKGDFLGSLGGEDQDFLERMWNPVVQVQGRVAMVWTPYDFHLDGEFSHCGVDVFTLLQGEEGWQVASITYNVVREGCPPSPLGPPGRSVT